MLNIDDDESLIASQARTAHRVEADAARAEDHDRLTGLDVRGVQDGTRASDDPAAEQGRLGERHRVRYDRELVFVNEGLFGEAAQPEALK